MTRSSHDVQIAIGKRAAVSSGHKLASVESLRILASGGNIVDAAIGGAMVLSVVLPYACGIGGDMYMLYHDAGTGITHGLNGTGAAPSKAHPFEFGGSMPQTGVRAATVPGVLMAWQDALSRFGTRRMSELLQPAILYARKGFQAHEGLFQNASEKRSLLERNVEASRIYLPGGNPHPIGHLVIQKELADSLSAVAEGGVNVFYEGELARRWIEGTDALGGLFTVEDFIRHRSLWQSAMSADFYGNSILTMPPNSSGVGLLLQLLALEAKRIDLISPCDGEFFIQTLRAWRWAQPVADSVIGDPRDAVVLAKIMLESFSSNPSNIGIDSTELGEGPASGDTSNLVIMDDKGNAVSLVQSVSAPFASGVVLPGTGILLNNRMRGFNLDEGNINCVAPGQRPAHTLVPALICRNGKVVMAIGTPGAAGQTITLAQVLCRIFACRQDAALAIAAPRWSISPSGKVILEDNATAPVVATLRQHEPALKLAPMRHVRFGSVKLVWKDNERLIGAADFRRVASTAAY